MVTKNKSADKNASPILRGGGAHGLLRITADITHLTCASVFEPGAETSMVAQFSTGAFGPSAADHERDVRSFALKFYTRDGNWDLVGYNTPVFFVRDPLKFSEFIRSQERHAYTNLRSTTAMWDFWSRSPESLHQLTILFSDRGLPVSPIHMNGYGSHTLSLLNEKGERVWVKFHFKTRQGHRCYTNDGAEDVTRCTWVGYQEALFNAIEAEKYPQWTLEVQVMTPVEAERLPFNPFDVTKVWPHADFPPIEVGVLELNRNVDNYVAEIEQLSFSPSNVVRGVDISPDRMLLGRIFPYADSYRFPLENPSEALAVNRPYSPVRHHDEGAAQRVLDNVQNPHARYEPNSFNGLRDTSVFREPRFNLEEMADLRDGKDDFSQPRALFLLFGSGQKARLFFNIAVSMKDVPESIVARQIELFSEVDSHYAAGVCAALDALDPQF